MIYKILKKTMIFFFFINFLTSVSCSQEKKEKVKSSFNKIEEIYYYRNYHCFDFVKRCELEILKIKNQDSLIYVKSSESHGEYEELHGKLTKINDSIYFVKTLKHIIQKGNRDKPLHITKDSIFFYCDSSLINTNITIEYLNGQRNEYQIYSTNNKFWINEKYFNKENNMIYLTLDCKNPIVDETIEIVSKYNDPKYSIVFESLQIPHDFYIIVKDNIIKTLNVGTESNQCLGPIFKLDRMKKEARLPKGRKLYK